MARVPLKRESVSDPEEQEASLPDVEAASIPTEIRNDPNAVRAETAIPAKPPTPTPPAPPSAPVAQVEAGPMVHHARRYQVRSSPGRVVYAGQVMHLTPGRILHSNTVNIAALEAQGVVFTALD